VHFYEVVGTHIQKRQANQQPHIISRRYAKTSVQIPLQSFLEEKQHNRLNECYTSITHNQLGYGPFVFAHGAFSMAERVNEI